MKLLLIAAGLFGVLTSGNPPATQTPAAPVVTASPCAALSPIANGVNVSLQGGGSCAFVAMCGSPAASCVGANTITGWAITAQSCASCYSITSTGILQGGTNGGNVISETDTVTVTATNTTGTSPGVVQTVSTIFAGSIMALGVL